MSILWAPVFLVYEPIKQTVVCIKYFVEFKSSSLSDKTDGLDEKLNKTLSADFALLHHKFYMVLIEDAAQVLIGQQMKNFRKIYIFNIQSLSFLWKNIDYIF